MVSPRGGNGRTTGFDKQTYKLPHSSKNSVKYIKNFIKNQSNIDTLILISGNLLNDEGK